MALSLPLTHRPGKIMFQGTSNNMMLKVTPLTPTLALNRAPSQALTLTNNMMLKVTPLTPTLSPKPSLIPSPNPNQ